MDNITIKDLDIDDRPREKMIASGIDSLSDDELLAILIDTGTKDKNAIEIAKDLIVFAGDISYLAKFDVDMMKKIKGIGIAKACKIVAAIEFANRVVKSNLKRESMVVTSPSSLIDTYKYEFERFDVEVFKLICLNTKNNIIYEKNISVGVANASLISPREIYKEALRRNATGIIAIHNHPSKNPEPSKDDIDITRKLVKASEFLDIRFLDHIIYGSADRFYSFKENGYI